MRFQYGGILGLILLALDIWAIISVIGSGDKTLNKVLWVLGILILPLVGFLVWFFMGPRSNRV